MAFASTSPMGNSTIRLDSPWHCSRAQAVHPDSFRFRAESFDVLAAGPELRRALEAGRSAPEIWATWEEDLKRFRLLRAKVLALLGLLAFPPLPGLLLSRAYERHPANREGRVRAARGADRPRLDSRGIRPNVITTFGTLIVVGSGVAFGFGEIRLGGRCSSWRHLRHPRRAGRAPGRDD